MIENRQKIGSDTLMPTPGLTIWHINDDIAQGWAVNNNEPYYGVGLEQADGMFAHENGGPSNGADVFPGDTDNTLLPQIQPASMDNHQCCVLITSQTLLSS